MSVEDPGLAAQAQLLNLDNLRLVAREECGTCKGTAEQPSEDWQAFENWARRRPNLAHDAADNDHLAEHYFLEVCGYDAVPAMREPCEACNGSGSVEVEVAAGDLLALIEEFVQRPLLPAAELDEVVDHIHRAMTAAASKSQGLADPSDAGSWLRVCQEAAEALRSIAELRPKRREQ